MAAFPQNIPLCFLPNLFYHSRPFPYAVTERSARSYWYTSLSQLHESQIIYQQKGTSPLFPAQFAPAALPRPRLSSLLSQEEEMDVRACAFLKLDAWKHLLLCKLNSRWASVCVGVKGLSGPDRLECVFPCICYIMRTKILILQAKWGHSSKRDHFDESAQTQRTVWRLRLRRRLG